MTESNPNLNKHSHLTNNTQNYQYVSDYQSSNYQPSREPLPGSSFAQSQAGRQGLYTVSNQQTSYYGSTLAQPNPTHSRVRTQTNNFVSSQVKNEQVVKGQSRINYVPYEKKVVEYEDRQYVQKVPVKKKKTRLEERRVVETIPKEVVKTDYYAVEKRVQYHKQIIPEKKIEMVQVQKKIKRYEYVPVEKQVVHYPQNIDLQTAKSQSRIVLRDQGINIKNDAEYKPIDPALIYNYSDRPESRFNNIGYVDQGTSRVLSTDPTPYVPPPSEYNYVAETTYATGGAYPTAPTNYTPAVTGNSYQNNNIITTQSRYQPFQRMEDPGKETYIRQSSPRLLVTDQNGGSKQQVPQYSRNRNSYITELDNMGQTQEVKRPFDNLNSNSRTRPGITQVKRQSGKKFQDYGPSLVVQEEQRSINVNNFQGSSSGWQTQK